VARAVLFVYRPCYSYYSKTMNTLFDDTARGGNASCSFF
jgi:hypothetical protein